MNKNKHCLYYQALVDKPDHLFVIGALKYYDHLCFDRALDDASGIIEFFVPIDQQKQFLSLMDRMKQKGIIKSLESLPNRLAESLTV